MEIIGYWKKNIKKCNKEVVNQYVKMSMDKTISGIVRKGFWSVLRRTVHFAENVNGQCKLDLICVTCIFLALMYFSLSSFFIDYFPKGEKYKSIYK